MPAGRPPRPDGDDVTRAKAALRVELLARRRARSSAERDAAHAGVHHALLGFLDERSAQRSGPLTVSAHLPLPSEPLGAPTLDALAADARVLVPVVTGAAPLDWTPYGGGTRAGPLGIAAPLGPRLGPATVATVDVVLVPALAADRAGRRLGRGGGHYDRTLAQLDDRGQRLPVLLAVLFDDEVLDAVPVDRLDRRVTHLLTPTGGVQPVEP